MRIFIALTIERDASLRIYSHILPLRTQFPSIRWIPPDNYHMTLCFLGEISELDYHKLVDSLSAHNFQMPSFTGRIAGVGFFPESGKKLRVVHAPMTMASECCSRLHDHIHRVCSLIVPDISHRFTPHLTLGRAKGIAPPSLRESAQAVGDSLDVSVVFTGFSIMESVLSNRGAKYIQKKRYALSR